MLIYYIKEVIDLLIIKVNLFIKEFNYYINIKGVLYFLYYFLT